MPEPLIGYRFWRLGCLFGKRKYLKSLVKDDIWKPNKPMIANFNWCADSSGIYSFKSYQDIDEYTLKPGNFPRKNKEWYDARNKQSLVIGEIKCWGRIFEHERGYRAEFAYPSKIIVPEELHNSNSLAQTLRREYGCETHVMKTSDIILSIYHIAEL